MKRTFKYTVVFAASLFVIWGIGSVAGFWRWYKIPTPSNEPSIMTGEHIMVTNLKKADRYCFVVYKSKVKDSLSGLGLTNQNYVQRVCGLPGDIVEMKKGRLFVNNKDFDEELDLKLGFLIPKENMRLLDEDDFSEEKGDINYYYNGTRNEKVLLIMHRKLIQKYSERFTLEPFYNSDTTQHIFKWYKGNSIWTADNFGPLKVATDSCFVIGDNRHNSLDSRYTGFVALKDISGTVINK